jgi:diguanylate cyclase (GGDEF)-like protein
MKKILLIEDSQVFGKQIIKEVKNEIDCEITWVTSLQNCIEIMEDHSDTFDLALVDLNLPDASGSIIVKSIQEYSIPLIVFTSDTSEELQEELWKYRIIDYIYKDGPESIFYLIDLIKGVFSNHHKKIVIVDDSDVTRKLIRSLLLLRNYDVYDVSSGKEALELLKNTVGIYLMIIDFHMENMNGLELIKEIRKKYNHDMLSIIGVSSSSNKRVSALFLKYGANDFISKPFLNEEFYCRVEQNIKMIEQIKTIKDISNKDYLTNLYNRRYFFQYAESFVKVAQLKKMKIYVAMIDIDFFKKINDTYGHDGGDFTLKQLAEILKKEFSSPDIPSRFGGEEFCILGFYNDKDLIEKKFDDLRQKIENLEINFNNKRIKITISIGLYVSDNEKIEEMISKADLALYDAKNTGRNKIIYYAPKN